MKNLKILCLIGCLFFSMNSFAKKSESIKKPTVSDALKALAKQCHNESIIEMLKMSLSEEDVVFLKEILKKNRIGLKEKAPYKFVGKNKLSINGKVAVFRMKGKEILYKGLGYRLVSHLSLRENIKKFSK